MELCIKKPMGMATDSSKELLRLEPDGSLFINPDELEVVANCLSETLSRVEKLRSKLNVGDQG